MKLILVSALLVTTLLTRVAEAQSPADRVALERLRDSLSFNRDVPALLSHEAQLIERARIDRDNAMHHLRLGFIALRLHQLRPSGDHIEAALSEFEWATELEPDWPWPWYGRGLAEASIPDRATGFAGGLHTMLGLDQHSLAGAAFSRSLEADPSFVAGIREFARVALTQRIDAPLIPALNAIRQATATPLGWDGQLLTSRGRLERLTQQPDSALRSFRLALLVGREEALGWLEFARTAALIGPAEGTAVESHREMVTRAYLRGAELADDAVMAMYRRDIEPILERVEIARFDSLAGTERVDWLERFWIERDALDLREPGSRLMEHFRRWDVARRDFMLPPFRRRFRFGIETFRSGDPEHDDRGIVYLRHGEPELRIIWPKGRGDVRRVSALNRNQGNESWRYRQPDGSFTLHFVARDDPNDYRLVETPLELDVANDQLAQFADDLPGLNRMMRAGVYSREWINEEVRRDGRTAMAIATQTDTWRRDYDEIVPGRVQWFAAGVRNGVPLVHIVYVLDAGALRAVPGADTLHNIEVKAMATFLGRDGLAVATLDTIQHFLVPRQGIAMVASRAEVVVPPGTQRVRFGVEVTPQAGVIFPLDSLVVPNPESGSLELSALLMGRRGKALSWPATPADTAWLEPGFRYGPEDTVSVYVEGYGITAGREVRLRLSITRKRTGLLSFLGGRTAAVTIADEIRAPGGVVRFRRDIGLGGLEPGDYALELTCWAPVGASW